MRTFSAALLALSCLSLTAGELQGTVQLLEKNGKPRRKLKDCIAILDPVGARMKVAPRPLLKIRTAYKQFTPRVAWTTPGSEVAFPNQDYILHNVFSLCCVNAFDTGHYEPGDSPVVKVKQPGLMKLYCNVHHSMNAFLWVVETPFAQVLDGREGVAFSDVPPGSYLLKLWHPETGERTFPVTIQNGVTRGAWTLSVNLPAFEPHKNKFGKDYPPGKDEDSY